MKDADATCVKLVNCGLVCKFYERFGSFLFPHSRQLSNCETSQGCQLFFSRSSVRKLRIVKIIYRFLLRTRDIIEWRVMIIIMCK